MVLNHKSIALRIDYDLIPGAPRDWSSREKHTPLVCLFCFSAAQTGSSV